MRGFRSCILLLMAAIVCAGVEQRAAADRVDDIIALLDPQADVIIAVPQLKRASDELTRCIEGMDRTRLLMGSRPIDQLKSLCTISAGVDELRGAAAMFYFADAPPTLFDVVFVVPVTDVATFVEGNFEPGIAVGEYIHPSGRVVYVREVANPASKTIALSLSKAALERYQPKEFENRAKAIIGDDLEALRKGEVFLSLREGALAKYIAIQPEQTSWVEWLQPLSQELNGGICVLDFDPLAAVARGHWLVRSETAGGVAEQKPTNAGGFSTFPKSPYIVALHVERPLLEIVQKMSGEDAAWLNDLDTFEMLTFAGAEHEAGLDQGALLRNSILVGTSDDAAATHKKFVEWAQSLNGTLQKDTAVNRVQRTIAGHSATPLSATSGIQSGPDDDGRQLEMFLFGEWRGFAMTVDGRVVVTGNQNEQWTQKTLESLKGSENRFGDSSMITIMRKWLPGPRHLELYIDYEMLDAEMMKFADVGRREPVRSTRPPIGVSATRTERGIETTLVAPAPTLAMIVDEVMRAVTVRMLTPREPVESGK